MDAQPIQELIREDAVLSKVDPYLALAIAQVESGFDPNLTRFEEHWSQLVDPMHYALHLGISIVTEQMLQKFSWGVMQVMGAVARELGFIGQLPTLIDPKLGVYYGCKKLAALQKHYTEEANIISAYNAGTPGKINNRYRNQEYVDRVSTVLKRLRGGN